MHCKQCGFVLPSGAAICPHCSSPTPYNAGTVRADSPTPPLPPTQLASGEQPPLPPTQLAPGTPAPLPPTQLASGEQPPLPPTQLASGPVSQLPPPPPSTPGWAPPSPSGPAWNFQQVAGQSGPGWAPPGPQQPAPVFVPVQPRPTSGCSTATIVVLVILLVLVCGGTILGGGIWYAQSRSAQANAQATITAISDDANATATAIDDNATATADTAQLTPTPYPPYNESNPPSGVDFSGTAQHIITYAQMASQVNSRYQPTELQSAFQIGQKVYLAYHWANIGYSGYIYMIWYFNGENIGSVKSDYISTRYSYYDGYSSDSFNEPGQGAIEVYWCGQSSCSDRQLAWVRPFSVTN